MKFSRDDVIAAIATPIGEGGISVIRVSGTGAIAAAGKCFRGSVALADAPSHTAHFGAIIDARGETIDHVVVTVFRTPHSYTGDDTAEISCHGGAFVTNRILEEVLACGARMAEPGEFTRRSFLNGKIDLSQAEAVGDLIHARTEVSRRAALQQLEGKLSSRIRVLRQRLLDLCGLLELELDFADEGIELAGRKQLSSSFQEMIDELHALIDSYALGKITREGVRVAIIGKPNVGKSSILNNLLNENRAIVTDVPGTTRDVIEESLNIGGILFTVIDTAGMRESEDHVEREGIRRSTRTLESADLILFVLDSSAASDDVDRKIASEIAGRNPRGVTLQVWNKSDMPSSARFRFDGNGSQAIPAVRCSAVTGDGIDRVKESMVRAIHGEEIHLLERSVAVTNLRQRDAIVKACGRLEESKVELERGTSNEFIAVGLRSVLDGLGEIIGEVTSDDLLDNIFSKFCIGK